MHRSSCLLLLMATQFLHAGPESRLCAELEPSEAERLREYVAERYRLSALPDLSSGVADGSCYRPVVFSLQSESKYFYRKFHLSPDGRFLIQGFEDTHANPQEAEKRQRARTRREVRETGAPKIGAKDPLVEIVVFSDLQCPYCKKGIQLLIDAVDDPDSDANLMYRHFPMSFHPWARLASEITACLALQDESAFWSTTRRVLNNQGSLTAETVGDAVTEVAIEHDIDLQALERCQEDGRGKGIVDRDIAAGQLNEVRGTPTFFVNGHRFKGVSNAEQIRSLIAQAAREASGN